MRVRLLFGCCSVFEVDVWVELKGWGRWVIGLVDAVLGWKLGGRHKGWLSTYGAERMRLGSCKAKKSFLLNMAPFGEISNEVRSMEQSAIVSLYIFLKPKLIPSFYQLVLEILGQADRRDLPNICLCNRRCFVLTQPILYSTFKQVGREEVPLFLRTIFARLRLSKHVKHIEFNLSRDLPFAASFKNGWGTALDVSFMSDRRAWIKHQIQNVGPDAKHLTAWFEDLLEGKSWDALAALLVHLCSPNLESIKFIYRAKVEPYLETLLGLAARRWQYNGGPYLPKLRSLRFLAPERHRRLAVLLMYNQHHRFLPKLFQFKHLQELSLEGVGADDRNDPYSFFRSGWFPSDTYLDETSWNQKKSKIRMLTITQSKIGPLFIKGFLEHFDALESFTYQRQRLSDRRMTYQVHGPCLLIPTNIKKGLVNAKHSLKKLVLQDPCFEWGQFEEEDREMALPSNLLGSMSEFTALKTLEVRASMIMGPSLQPGLDEENTEEEYSPYTPTQCFNFAHGLPPSLEYLTLTGCQPPIFDALAELLFKKDGLNKLKSIHVSCIPAMNLDLS
jgi:hypothetical protein